MRFDLYTTIHKAQRYHLFKLSIEIGKADFVVPVQVANIKINLDHMIRHIRKHAQNEDTFIHPLFTVCKDQGEILEKQHLQIEMLLDELDEIIETNSFDRLYAVFNRFIAIYLQHTDLEEQIQKESLWRHYSDDELKAVIQRYQQSLTWQENLEGMDFMIPALNVPELEKMLTGMKQALPEAKFQQILLIAEQSFGKDITRIYDAII